MCSGFTARRFVLSSFRGYHTVSLVRAILLAVNAARWPSEGLILRLSVAPTDSVELLKRGFPNLSDEATAIASALGSRPRSSCYTACSTDSGCSCCAWICV